MVCRHSQEPTDHAWNEDLQPELQMTPAAREWMRDCAYRQQVGKASSKEFEQRFFEDQILLL
jgi:hypothetical protein